MIAPSASVASALVPEQFGKAIESPPPLIASPLSIVLVAEPFTFKIPPIYVSPPTSKTPLVVVTPPTPSPPEIYACSVFAVSPSANSTPAGTVVVPPISALEKIPCPPPVIRTVLPSRKSPVPIVTILF